MIRRTAVLAACLLAVVLVPALPAAAGGGCHGGVTQGKGDTVEMIDAQRIGVIRGHHRGQERQDDHAENDHASECAERLVAQKAYNLLRPRRTRLHAIHRGIRRPMLRGDDDGLLLHCHA